MKNHLKLLAAGVALLVLAGCATQHATPVASPAAAAPAAAMTTAKEFFAVLPENGRIYAFGDTKNYFDYLAHEEVALTRTRIGAGPSGQTIVYGITKADVKANTPSMAELVFEDKVAPATDFYGEVFKSGRFYVFGDYKDMKPFIAFAEVPYSYTDVGAGPKGETIVWVMNKTSYKKGRPVATIERFKSIRAKK